MKKLLTTLAAAFLVACASVYADTSYLLVQGPFGLNGATETFKWKVFYDPGTLVTGQDLLNAAFGIPVVNGTYTDGFGGTYDYFTAGNATQGAGYFSFYGSLLTESFTLDGTKVAMDPSYSPTWSYFVAGGSGNVDPVNNPTGLYGDGAWSYSNDGLATRQLTDGSFDGWVFEADNYPNPQDPIAGSSNAPTVSDFADATEVTVVPEPGSVALVLIGIAGVWAFRKREWLRPSI